MLSNLYYNNPILLTWIVWAFIAVIEIIYFTIWEKKYMYDSPLMMLYQRIVSFLFVFSSIQIVTKILWFAILSGIIGGILSPNYGLMMVKISNKKDSENKRVDLDVFVLKLTFFGDWTTFLLMIVIDKLEN